MIIYFLNDKFLENYVLTSVLDTIEINNNIGNYDYTYQEILNLYFIHEKYDKVHRTRRLPNGN